MFYLHEAAYQCITTLQINGERENTNPDCRRLSSWTTITKPYHVGEINLISGARLRVISSSKWIDVVHDWHLVFLQAIPLDAVAAALVWYGLPHDMPRYERLRQFDWRGALLIVVGVGSLTTQLLQGDHLDWFNSSTISLLALASAVAFPLLILNEWRHPLPLLKLQMLGRRNFAYATT